MVLVSLSLQSDDDIDFADYEIIHSSSEDSDVNIVLFFKQYCV